MDPEEVGLDGVMVEMLRELSRFPAGVEGLGETNISLTDARDDRRMRTLIEDGYVRTPSMRPRGDGRIGWSLHDVRISPRGRDVLALIDQPTASDVGTDEQAAVIVIVGDIIAAGSSDARPRSERRVDPTISTDEGAQIEACLGRLRRDLDSGQLDVDDPVDLADLHAQLATIEDQLRSPRPSRGVLRQSFSIIGALILGALSGVARNALWTYVPQWLGVSIHGGP